MNLLNLLIIIFTHEESYLSIVTDEPEMYKYLITPFSDTMFTLKNISDGSLFVRLTMVSCLVQVDDNSQCNSKIYFRIFLLEINVFVLNEAVYIKSRSYVPIAHP